jgi:hypothetical protein
MDVLTGAANMATLGMWERNVTYIRLIRSHAGRRSNLESKNRGARECHPRVAAGRQTKRERVQVDAYSQHDSHRYNQRQNKLT